MKVGIAELIYAGKRHFDRLNMFLSVYNTLLGPVTFRIKETS